MGKILNEALEKELICRSARVRYLTVELINLAGSGHTGGDMSAADLLVAIYSYMRAFPENPDDDKRDFFIMSKGHSAEIFYEVLAEYKYFERERLNTLGTAGSEFGGHPTKNIPGVEANTGSLGHGLGIGAGIALGLKRNNQNNKVYVLTGDGELAEGTNWEAAMFASKYRLDNFTWIIDRNELQISGNTEEVMPLEPLQDKLQAFGFQVTEIDGHDFKDIYNALNQSHNGKPKAIIARTVKGKGLAVAENMASWHHQVPSLDHVVQMKIDMQCIIEENS